MLHVGDILSALHGWAPPAIAWERDNVGLLIGRSDAAIEKALICLDVTPGIVEEAVRLGASLIIAHHPVIFHPLKSLRTDRPHGALLAELLRRDINVIALHTNADAARFGLNYALAEALTIRDAEALDPSRGHLRQLRLQVAAPAQDSEILNAFLDSQAEVSWSSHSVESGQRVLDIRVPSWETRRLCSDLSGLLGQTPHSISETRLEDGIPGYGIGAVGTLENAMDVRDFLQMVKTALRCSMLRVSPYAAAKRIHRVAVCSGAGASYVSAAVAAGADAIVTGDLTHHVFLDYQPEILLVDAGHYDTEHLFIDLCAKHLANMAFENNEKIDILTTMTNTNPIWFE